MTEYTLDISKWRCGGDGKHSLGEGLTEMLNREGYMCCLGQFAKQAGVTDCNLLNADSPSQVAFAMEDEYDRSFIQHFDQLSGFLCYNTALTHHLMNINDDCDTTPCEKVAAIKEALDKVGHSLKIVDGENILKGGI